MKTLLMACVTLAAASMMALGEDFPPQWPAVRQISAQKNDWQKLIDKVNTHGWNIGSEEYPVLGFVEPPHPPKTEHRVDYFEIFGGGEGTFMNSENWTAQIDTQFARRVIEMKPDFFWKVFGAWPADPAGEPRVAELLRHHPELKPVFADRSAPVALPQARQLLDFLDAHPDLRARYSHLDIYVDQWIFRHSGPDVVECDHYLIIENRASLDDYQEKDPEGGCGKAALAKHSELMKFWLDYQPPATPPAVAPHPPSNPAPAQPRDPRVHNISDFASGAR